MTLSNQNKVLLTFSIISAALFVFFVIGIIYFFMHSTSLAFFKDIFNSDFSMSRFLMEKNSFYVIISLLLMSVYVPVVCSIVHIAFEKTNSSEIIFFVAMLFGFFAETARLAIPIFALEETYTLFLRYICRISFFGQMHVALSILLQGAFANDQSTRETDRLLGVISIISLCLSLLIPINYSTMKEFYIPIFGFQSIFEIIRILIVALAVGAMLLSPLSRKSVDAKITSVGFFIIIAGYMALLKSTMLLTVLIGIVGLTVGTYLYLRHLYAYYMWK